MLPTCNCNGVSFMKSTILEDVAATYGVEHWGAGFFAINRP